jgi:hypothetical protein
MSLIVFNGFYAAQRKSSQVGRKKSAQRGAFCSYKNLSPILGIYSLSPFDFSVWGRD